MFSRWTREWEGRGGCKWQSETFKERAKKIDDDSKNAPLS